MTKPNNGGPAFPAHMDVSDGMSLRDWFAGQVIAAMGAVWAHEGFSPDEIAAAAYDHADAMLRAREE